MIERGRMAELLRGTDDEILGQLPVLLPEMTTGEIFDLFSLLEDPDIFRGRLPLRLKIFAAIAQSAPAGELKLLALIRLLRRLGARRDIPRLGEIPEASDDFAEYLGNTASNLCDDNNLVIAIKSLAQATKGFRSGDLNSMSTMGLTGIDAINNVGTWVNPPEIADTRSLLISEVGHELLYIAVNARFRSGDVNGAERLTEHWSKKIHEWEELLGPLPRQRYQYYQITGHLNFEVGLYNEALESYHKALEYAPTRYRKAFLWLSEAQIERKLGRTDQSWLHASHAIDAILDSPYPQSAATWIEWLALDASSEKKKAEINGFRRRLNEIGGIQVNRVTRAMTSLYRVLADLRSGIDPSGIAPVLENILSELEEIESWPNIVTLLATKAVVAGRLNDRDSMDSAIEKAREVINTRLAPDAQPPASFFLENANALALRDVGAYDEAFDALFEGALEARKKYPGAMGPDEQTTMEALYYLGALSGNDPESIERRIREVLNP